MSTVYRKTAKGQAEIETRAFRLLPRLRQALILVDGRRSDDELAQMIFAEPQATLQALRADGFIEVTAEAPAKVAEPTAAAAAAAAPSRKAAPSAASPDALRRDAVRYLSDQLGPAADGIAMKLERAKTMTELRPLLESASQLLGSFRGPQAAEAFSARFLGAPAG